jgi:DNA-binding transcriptional LysR family regulator
MNLPLQRLLQPTWDIGLNVRQLRVFVTVVETGSFTRAAEQLYLTQAAISSHVQRLRAQFGLPLLTREGRRVRPTEAGTTLYTCAVEILSLTDALQRTLAQIASGELGAVVIGSNRVYGTYMLPPILARFAREHPTLKIDLVQESSDDLIEHVRKGAIDLAVTSPRNIPQELLVADLGVDEMVVVEAGQAPFTKGNHIVLADLARMPFIHPTASPASLTAPMDNFLARHGLQPPTVLGLSTWEGVRAAVAVGVGLAIVPRSVVKGDLTQGDLREVKVEGYKDVRHVSLICSPSRRQSDAPVFHRLLTDVRDGMIEALGTRPRRRPNAGFRGRTG